MIDNMDELALYASTNTEIRSAFVRAKHPDFSDSDLSKATVGILSSISIPNSSSHYRISLYNEKGNFISIGIPYNKAYTSKKLISEEYHQWYKNLPILPNKASVYGFHEDYWSEKDERYLSLFREIFGINALFQSNGIIEIQCPLSTMTDALVFEDSSYSAFLYDEKGTLIWPLEDPKPVSENLFKCYMEHQTGDVSSPHNRGLMYNGRPVRNGLHLILTQSEEHIWSIILPQIFIILSIGLLSVIMLVFVVFHITKHAAKPLQELASSVKQVSYSNLSLELNFTDYPDEITALNEAFEKMFQRLRQSMDEIVRMQACETRANMVALQSQMNPHFLYNTLTVIKALSREGNTMQIALTCDYLVKMLRYISMYDEHSSNLKQELSHTENYLNLMKIRYEDQFSYSISIDSDVNVEKLKIPKLTIQPLVENCFQHGFKSVAPPWTVHIHFWVCAPHWYVSITDNGIGITEEAKTELLNRISEFLSHSSDAILSLKIGGMGLVNTVARLKLKYGDSILFDINSTPGGGTTIVLGGFLEDEYLCN
ncbi:MAG: histidine kinase [Eubacteriales bacterium]|nr:histidine kinase [Eubacteriales bacterium]